MPKGQSLQTPKFRDSYLEKIAGTDCVRCYIK